MSGWEVRPSNRSHERRLRVALILLLMAVPSTFYLGSWWQARAMQEQDVKAQAMQARLDEQSRELDELRQRMAVLSSGEQLAQQSNEQSRLTIKLLEEQIFKQQQELAFYKGVLAPDSRADGVLIRTFDIHPTEEAGVFRFKIMLSRVGKDDKPMQGRLHVQVEGRQVGKAASLQLSQLSSDLPSGSTEQSIPFAFKHLQAIPEGGRLGELRLPEGFEPQQIRIKADVEGGKPVERQIEWADG
ncbi:hypothetical protein DNK06_16300 [Pseudomonas daroniae]|uniref:Uncharacterized protein n=1 Tax=Phytopseudomonas daroniae TaxID=2487519 RepID=A0A4Q9QLN7_9GAMM|nr:MULTISPECIES: DUF6776 family protein [Pseudomonas]TBU76849.1 hypothetical protein DNK06_16300 [Pseudomonas daroniae]TBU81420.1 hypothetical protein DNK31_15015 [Pseudomonas sp. FRB 228]TBU90537.1 hypothetical protein DNJ99_13080 [Pseudomonas daroniae]